MKKKATLLIQHLEKIYPMAPSIHSTITHGYIAIHHDEILNFGVGEGWDYVDKDTRILEGSNHIAVPAFLDVSLHLLQAMQKIPASMRIVKLKEHQEILMKHGTLLINFPESVKKRYLPAFASYDSISIVHKQPLSTYPILSPFQSPREKKRFCISTQFPQTDCLDQWLCMKLYAHQYPQLDPMLILAAATRYPAKALQLHNYGIITKGAHANVILMEGNEFGPLLTKFHGEDRMSIIKDGVRLYPYLLV